MDVSIGIMAYNEGSNIGCLLKALLNQKTKKANIKEIIVVSSGSVDQTNKIVKSFCKKNRKIKLVIEKERKGKVSAINKFLKISKSDVLVLESADTIPEKCAIENLCKPLQNRDIGAVASHPIPRNLKKNYLGFAISLQWALHHKISMEKPKFGEVIAFRKLFREIKNTAVDEEYIAMLIKELGFRHAYAKNSIVYNSGPKTISDFLKQRRRIYCGHLELKKKKGYVASTMGNPYVFGKLLKSINPMEIFPVIFAVVLEGYGRLLGVLDYYTNKKHYVWDIAKTSKK